ncbi:DNA adenine methylase [Subtercola sp. PAMC28395]|uniref:DNA adenine methylase n=1 Tax=Subtercola sp. PAMC28395 TaxID=2846775 RepID=UPI001C0A9A11|nr:DNA adenine methylase [Subtercola sp. PAMC28395]QWT22817.1 DNA adenine methylase [Subtercola sp. PAMC28395]
MSQLSRYPSPLRYPGGKGKIANFVKVLMIENALVGRDYVEPYAGGASVALSLLYEGYADRAFINDLNPGVHAFWSSAVSQTDQLCQLIESTPITMQTWHEQREIAKAPEAEGLELGFATFFLNRTNRSGIINGGVIGGLDQTGQWKVDARYNVDSLVQRIRKIGRHRSSIVVSNEDAVEFVKQWSDPAADPAFLYLDPPYFEKGEGLYDNFYDADDHVLISESVASLAHPWIVSYDARPEITRLYPGAVQIRYGLTYSANLERTSGSEIMFFHDGLTIPSMLPSGISASQVAQAQRQALAL